jgi:general secretion pathway protein M
VIAVKQWWQSLAARERMIVAILIAIVIVMIFQLMVWKPLYQARDKAQNSVVKQAELLQWMQQRSNVAKQLQRVTSTASTFSNLSLSQRINTSAKQSKLEINRFQSSGNDAAQVWLDKANFSSLLLWLEALQVNQSVIVESIAVNQTSESGIVSVRATFSAF